jgi:hypothetical protein
VIIKDEFKGAGNKKSKGKIGGKFSNVTFKADKKEMAAIKQEKNKKKGIPKGLKPEPTRDVINEHVEELHMEAPDDE